MRPWTFTNNQTFPTVFDFHVRTGSQTAAETLLPFPKDHFLHDELQRSRQWLSDELISTILGSIQRSYLTGQQPDLSGWIVLGLTSTKEDWWDPPTIETLPSIVCRLCAEELDSDFGRSFSAWTARRRDLRKALEWIGPR